MSKPIEFSNTVKEAIYGPPPQIIELLPWQVSQLADLGISPAALILFKTGSQSRPLTAVDLVKIAMGIAKQQGRDDFKQELREMLGIKRDS